MQHIRGLFEPIFKLAHATRIEIKYNDAITSCNSKRPFHLLPPVIAAAISTIPQPQNSSGDTAAMMSMEQDNTNAKHTSGSQLPLSYTPFPALQKAGVMPASLGQARVYKPNKPVFSRPSLLGSRSDIAINDIVAKNVSGEAKKRPHILSFRANHALCRPPDAALPVELGGDHAQRLPTHAMDMVNRFMRKSVVLNESRRHLLRDGEFPFPSYVFLIKYLSKCSAPGLLICANLCSLCVIVLPYFITQPPQLAQTTGRARIRVDAG